MAPRFRPVALRPRLSAGLPNQPFEYAQDDASKQARRVSNPEHKKFPSVKSDRFCQRNTVQIDTWLETCHGSGPPPRLLARLARDPFACGNCREINGNRRAGRYAGDLRGVLRVVREIALRRAGNRGADPLGQARDHRGECPSIAPRGKILTGSSPARLSLQPLIGPSALVLTPPTGAAPGLRYRKSAHPRTTRTRLPPR